MLQLIIMNRKIQLFLRHFSVLLTLSEVGGAVFLMNSKIHLTEINILHYFGLNSLSGTTADQCSRLKPVFDLINWSHRSTGK